MDVLLADSCYSLLNAGRHMANKIQKDPKVVILVGMEGISGIDDWHQIAYGCRSLKSSAEFKSRARLLQHVPRTTSATGAS